MLSNFGVLFCFFYYINFFCFRFVMVVLFLFVVLVVVVNVYKNFIVIEEVWFDVEIKDYDGIGEDYRG